jgi:hypothetical protein
MSWAFLDDHADENPKLMAVGGEAAWYWACGLCYCRRNPKVPGFIPYQKAFLLYPTKNPQALVARLVDVHLWAEVDGGFQVNDYGKIYKSEGDAVELATKRAEAGRLGGLAKAGKKLAKQPSKLPDEPPSKEAERSLANEPKDSGKNLAHVSATRATRVREDPTPTPTDLPDTTTQGPDRSPADPNRMGPKAVVAADGTLPIAERARKVLENPVDGYDLGPSRWPEVQAIGKAWAFGMALDLRDNARGDSDLRAILEALAAGSPPDRLVAIGPLASKSEYFKKIKRPGPAAFTAAVIRRLLAELDGASTGTGAEVIEVR